MQKLIYVFMLLCICTSAQAKLTGSMLGSEYPNTLNNLSGSIDLGGGSASTGCTVDGATGNIACSGDLTINGKDILSALTGSADDILIKPGGVTALTVAEGGNATLVGDLVVTGGDVTALIFKSAATGGDDAILIQPAGVSNLSIFEAGSVQINKVMTVHGACAAAGDVGKIEVFSVANTISFCGCWQSAASTFAWVGLHAGATCS